MNVKEYLMSRSDELYALDAGIKRKRVRLAALRSRLTGSTAPPDGSPGGGSGNGPESALCALVDLQREIEQNVNALAEKQAALAHEIERVRRPEWRAVLEMRYVDRMGWKRIARAMKYSEPAVYKLHGRALQDFGERRESV